MFKGRGLDPIREMFSAQFEADSDGYLYRKNRKNAPVRVSARERDDFVAAFDRNYTRAYRVTMIVTMLVILGMVTIAVVVEGDLPEPVTYAAVGTFLVVFLMIHRRMWNAPARALERRPAVGQERSRSEMRVILMAETSDIQSFIMLAMFLLLLFTLATQSTPLNGLDVFLMAVYVVVSIMTGLVIFRKWRLGRQSRTS
ncbi:MAG: hypothetical protein JNL35_17170 [Sphingopyxis sp.]|nr:hypothetical protein [Sphingopyxis sp.]